MSRFKKPRLLSDREVNMIRGKALVAAMTPEDQMAICGHLTMLEMKLDEQDLEDRLGTEGWRHLFGVPDVR
jgi:hypothetical protein